MARPRTPVGSHGAISVKEVAPGRWRARARYRFADGTYRQIERFVTVPLDAGMSSSRRIAAEKAGRRRAAEAIERALVELTRSGGDAPAPTMKIAQLGQAFLTSKAGDRTAPATHALYARTLDKLILPRFGSLTVTEATVPRLQALVDGIRADHGPASAKSARSVLSGMFALAVRTGALQRNPVRELEGIRQARDGAKAITQSELEFLLAAVRTDARLSELDLVDLIEFMAGTGCRVGEAIALQWDDVDLGNGTVRLHATVVRVVGRGLVRQDHGKTAASGRTIQMPARLLEVLSARRERISGALVFPTVLGNLRDPQNTSRDWREARERLGLGDVKLHAFRKTVATLLDSAGLSARDIAEYLGHANPSMTQDVYMSKTAGTARAAALLSEIVV
ncbi:tyrosine-type recombinase/integrase [Microcella frigidaquae]|uniref:tyrosine-type recombinase/integrase n=2 Tax=Microcella frigidaquae TaxID=424758 RepID=UPI00140556FD